ncbi:MAG: AbrB family transcriptional regulator [Alphaproteobacteria bacterium]|nr:AbrB family transcriptional regulator [Alphaproteobacteria bacterium]
MTAWARARLSSLPVWAQWLLLTAVSLGLGALLEDAEIPAALLLGPMAGAILLGLLDGKVKLPRTPYIGAQAVVGCLIASTITPGIVRDVAANAPVLFAVVASVIAASSLLGWLISRWQILPGSAGVWGSAPGGATAMVLMAEAFGADARLVAFMQYLRVACVASVASLLARFWLHLSGAPPAIPLVWLPPLDAAGLATTLGFVLVGGAIGQALRIPSGAMLVPMIVGAILRAMGLIHFQLPEWLLAFAYAVIGWRIGLSFTPEVLHHAARAFARILASILLLIAFAFGLAFLLTRLFGIDLLTAYLATSPGGMDSVAIIAASSHVDMSFVMALQTVRFFMVILLGPVIARTLARGTTDAAQD